MKALLVAVLAVAAACAPVPATTTPRPSPPDASATGLAAPCAQATFVFANADGLWCLDADARKLGPLAALPQPSAVTAPVLEPDGRTIAFTLTLAPDVARGFGTDIAEVALDGTGFRVLVSHERESVFYAKPNFDPSGRVLYVSRSDAGGTRIERIDLATGQHATVVLDAADPALSPDGRQLVYIHLSGGQADGLWTAAADGTGAHRLVATTFTFLQSPRFSPSGALIAFCASGRGAQAPGGPRVAMTGGSGKLAHLGIPAAVFMVRSDGTALEQVAQAPDDQEPTWSKDSAQLAFVATAVFSITTVATKATRTVASAGMFAYGEAVWLR